MMCMTLHPPVHVETGTEAPVAHDAIYDTRSPAVTPTISMPIDWHVDRHIDWLTECERESLNYPHLAKEVNLGPTHNRVTDRLADTLADSSVCCISLVFGSR